MDGNNRTQLIGYWELNKIMYEKHFSHSSWHMIKAFKVKLFTYVLKVIYKSAK